MQSNMHPTVSFLGRRSGAEGTGQCGMGVGTIDFIQIHGVSVPCIASESDPPSPLMDNVEGWLGL